MTRTRKNLKDKFDAFIDIVTQRNDLIFQYNIIVNLLLQKTEEKAEYEAKQKKLQNRQVKYNDPDLPVITAYVEAIYQSSRLRVMKLLSTLLRSLNFRMLRSFNFVAFAFGSEDPDHDTGVEEWSQEPVRFPANFDHDVGNKYPLKENELEQLIDGHSVKLKIPPVMQDSESVGDFRGCCNVRVYRARFGFTGHKMADGVGDEEDALVHAQLTHGGDETIVNRSNTAFEFEHNPVATIHSYRLRNDGQMSVLNNGNIGESDINNNVTSYTPPGPFAEWKVDLNGTEFEKLDFSGVTEAFFDFCGTNYPFF